MTGAETETIQSAEKEVSLDRKKLREQQRVVWSNVAFWALLHVLALYGVTLLPSANPRTWVWIYLCCLMGGIGVTAGAHRLWSHKSYKARWPLKLILMVFSSMAAQNSIFDWARDHHVHHKYSDTEADPHNAARGFFFSHCGWLMMTKHPDVITKGQQFDLSDLYADRIVMFQKRYYKLLSNFFNQVFPVLVPWYFWNENLLNAYIICYAFRYVIALHGTWTINSVAHLWGTEKRYDQNMYPRRNLITIFGTTGEGFHNFHHSFPQDYAASEMGLALNPSKWFIELAAMLGLAYDLKSVSKETIIKRRMRTGDMQHLANNQ